MSPNHPRDTSSSDASSPATRPLAQTTLRYSFSEKEYALLHHYLLRRCPPNLRASVLTPGQFKNLIDRSDDFNAAAVRASVRVFLATQTGLSLWEWLKGRALKKGKPQRTQIKAPFYKSANFRLSLSLSLILLLHRFLFRFFSRLRSNLLSKDAAPFRKRNPRVSRSLTSKLAPAVGASLAGFALGVYPGDQLRLTVAIYAGTRSLEFLYDALDGDGWFKNKPWWWGSWLLTPLATGQLLHAFVFDRDCFPKAYGDFILDHTPNYVQKRPPAYPANLPWPSTNEIVDSLAEMSRLNWPLFKSPILFPNLATTLPPTLSVLSPITSPASPSHTALSCATLHPSDPSCTRTLAQYILTAFPATAKFFAGFYALFALPQYRKFLKDPGSELNKLARKVLKTSTFITGAIGTAWASICFFQATLPQTSLASSRWFWGGFAAGLWAFVDRHNGRGQFLYSMRMSVESLWKVGQKRGWWKGWQGGDVLVFVVSLMIINGVYEKRKNAVDARTGKGLAWLRGEASPAPKTEGQDAESVSKKSE